MSLYHPPPWLQTPSPYDKEGSDVLDRRLMRLRQRPEGKIAADVVENAIEIMKMRVEYLKANGLGNVGNVGIGDCSKIFSNRGGNYAKGRRCEFEEVAARLVRHLVEKSTEQDWMERGWLREPIQINLLKIFASSLSDAHPFRDHAMDAVYIAAEIYACEVFKERERRRSPGNGASEPRKRQGAKGAQLGNRKGVFLARRNKGRSRQTPFPAGWGFRVWFARLLNMILFSSPRIARKRQTDDDA